MTAPTAKQVSAAEKGLQALAAASLAAEDPPGRSEVHTYADGTQVVGVPPFPAKSPKEVADEEARTASTMFVPHGMKQSGVNTSDLVVSGMTPERAKWMAEQQLTADVLSGKDPHTPNPTTASDKPVLAGTGNVITAGDVESKAVLSPSDPEDLKKVADKIEPKGNIKASDEQKEGAAVQVIRETGGPVVVDTKKGK